MEGIEEPAPWGEWDPLGGVNAVVYIVNYDFGPGHPFRGDRFRRFMSAFRGAGLASDPRFEVIHAEPAGEEDLLLAHSEELIRRIERGESRDPDTPLRPGIYEAAKIAVGASMRAGELVFRGSHRVAFGLGGGLHHASRDREAGFCVFNDVAICALSLLERLGAKRILILDMDAHAGDGTAEIFYRDPRVLLVDLHQDPRTLYPFKGFPWEVGEGEGEGFTVNVPLPPGSSIMAYEYALREIFEPLAEEFSPDIIIRNGGSDPHFADGLANLGLTAMDFKALCRIIKSVADRVCHGRVVDLIASGYNPEVLPSCWLAIVSGSSGADFPIDEPLPPPPWLRRDSGLEGVKRVVAELKRILSDYWGAFD
jgi:acetoin utilization protein AcuC